MTSHWNGIWHVAFWPKQYCDNAVECACRITVGCVSLLYMVYWMMLKQNCFVCVGFWFVKASATGSWFFLLLDWALQSGQWHQLLYSSDVVQFRDKKYCLSFESLQLESTWVTVCSCLSGWVVIVYPKMITL